MSQDKIATSALHDLPKDLEKVLNSNTELLQKWNDITDIARNEWICWLTFVKKAETREKHLLRLQTELLKGKKRPCCWAGCPHRNPNNKKWFR